MKSEERGRGRVREAKFDVAVEALECRNSDVRVRSTAPLSGVPDGAGAIEVAGKGEKAHDNLGGLAHVAMDRKGVCAGNGLGGYGAGFFVHWLLNSLTETG